METLPANLKAYRNQRGYTQQKLADIVAVKKNNISNWENGVSAPPLSKLLRLANALGVSVDRLLKDRDNFVQPNRTNIVQESCTPNYVHLSPNLVHLIDNHCPYVGAKHLQRYAIGNLEEDLPHASIPGLRPGSQGFQVIGDAMQPHLKAGQYIWCTKKAQAADVRPGSIYFITYSPSMFSTCYAKAEAGGLTLYYSNYQEYPPQHIPISAVQEVWECYAVLSYL